MSNLSLGSLITQEEGEDLALFVEQSLSKFKSTKHNAVMKWLDGHPLVMQRFASCGVLKAYGAYFIEHQLLNK